MGNMLDGKDGLMIATTIKVSITTTLAVLW